MTRKIFFYLLILILSVSVLQAQPVQEETTTKEIVAVEALPAVDTATNTTDAVVAEEPLAASASLNNPWNGFPEGMVPPEGMAFPEGMTPPEGFKGGGFQMTGVGGKTGTVGVEGSFSSTVDLSSYEKSVSSPDNPLTYYDADDILDETEYEVITVSLNNGTLETSALPEGITIEVNGDGNVVITNSGKAKMNYVLSGSWNGTVMVTSKKADYMVTLDGVSITGTTLPGMQLKSAVKAFLVLKGENYVSDSKDNTKKGALTSGGDVIINGTGSLTIYAYKKHGLKVDGTVRLVSGTLHAVTDVEAEGNALSIDDAYIQDGGALVIEANGSVYTSESKGLKVNGRELEENAKGYLVINGGTIDIVSVGKAMTAGWKIAEDAETETTADDPTPNLIINNGVLRLTTTGIPYEYSDEESLSPEGLEAKNLLQINGGYIELIATDDGLNAGGSIEINGGLLFAYSRAADALDSNGTVVINGGESVFLGSSMPEMGLDMDTNTAFTYHSGVVVAMGGGNNTPAGTETDGCAISFFSPVSSGATFALVDESGKAIVAYQVPSWYTSGSSVEILSGEIKIGSTYKVLADVEAAGDEFFNGLYLDNVSVTGGAEKASYQVTSYVTGIQGMSFGAPGDMGGGRGMMGPRPEGMPNDRQGGWGMAPSQGNPPSNN